MLDTIFVLYNTVPLDTNRHGCEISQFTGIKPIPENVESWTSQKRELRQPVSLLNQVLQRLQYKLNLQCSSLKMPLLCLSLVPGLDVYQHEN